MTPSECQAWIQTGLALTPFCGHVMNTSLEWAVAWSWWDNGLLVQCSCPRKENGQGKDIRKILSLRMINGQSLCSRGLELVLNKGLFPPCLPSLGKPHLWSFLEMACFSAANCQWQMSTGDTCENHVRELRTFFTVVLEPNIHTFSVLSETLPDFFKSKLC